MEVGLPYLNHEELGVDLDNIEGMSKKGECQVSWTTNAPTEVRSRDAQRGAAAATTAPTDARCDRCLSVDVGGSPPQAKPQLNSYTTLRPHPHLPLVQRVALSVLIGCSHTNTGR
jgi:hypothetical protein